MKLLKLALKRDRAMPMLAMVFASVSCVSLVLARIILTGNIRYGFLIWNLILALLPLVFALFSSDRYDEGSGRNWRSFGCAGAWLLFFSYALYIFTVLFHHASRFYDHVWVDLFLILLCALTGLVLGFVSLYLMQAIVRRMFGTLAAWLFIVAITALSGFAVYIGRFLRFNSWDVVLQPMKLFHGVGHWVANPMVQPTSFAFPLLFATFLFISYVMLYGLTHLQPSRPAASQ